MEKLITFTEFINEAAFDVETELMDWVEAGNPGTEEGDLIPDTMKTFIESKLKENVIDLGGAKKFMIYFTEKDQYVDHYFVKAKNEKMASIVAFLVYDNFELDSNNLGGDLENYLESRRMSHNCIDITLSANYL